MPKPVLSDSLFNADDVATAVLGEANLSITNSTFGITDVTSSFAMENNCLAWAEDLCLKFQNIVFVNLSAILTFDPSTPDQKVYSITDSNLRPSDVVYLQSAYTYEGENATYYEIATNGDINIHRADNQGDTNFRFLMNNWYYVG